MMSWAVQAKGETRKGAQSRLRRFFQGDNKDQGKERYRNAQPESSQKRNAAEKRSDKDGGRDADYPVKDPAGKTVLHILFIHAHSHGDSKGKGAAHDGRGDDPGETADQCVIGKPCRHLISSHVNGKDAPEHSRILAKEMVYGGNDPSQHIGKDRSQTNDTGHGKGRPSHQVKGSFESFTQAETISDDAVQTAQNGANRKNDL